MNTPWIRIFVFSIDLLIIISLIIPAFRLVSFSFKEPKTFGVLISNWPDPKNYVEEPEVWGELPPKRNYIEVNLTGNISEDELKLTYSRQKMRDILLNKDSVTGIHYTFGSESYYKTFIRLLDICNIENARNYIPHNNNFWFFYQNRRHFEHLPKIQELEL